MLNNSFSYLLPNLTEVFAGTPAGVSAVIWAIMYFFAMYATNYVLTRYFKAQKIISLLKDFKVNLDDTPAAASLFVETLKKKKKTRVLGLLLRDLLSNITENPAYTGAESGEGSLRYISSTQLKYYLNTRDIVPDLFDNKFITFVPSLLTGFGVLGTFVGIQLGIGGLDFKVDDVENMTESISLLLAGSTVAFMTSIWGVFFSLVFGVGEKTLLRKLQYQFHDVEYLIGANIVFISPENEVVKMREYNSMAVDQLKIISQQFKDLDMKLLAVELGNEVKKAVEIINPATANNESTQIIEDMGALIISELRLIKEASQEKPGGGSSLLNLK